LISKWVSTHFHSVNRALDVVGPKTLEPSALPDPPHLLAPLPAEVLRSETFDQIFRWEEVEGAEVYSFARDESFFDMVSEPRVVSGTTVRLHGLEPGACFCE
jgi:hypothetical protein